MSDLVSTLQAIAAPPVATQQQALAQSPRPAGLLPSVEEGVSSDGHDRSDDGMRSSISLFTQEQSTPSGIQSSQPAPSTQLASIPQSPPVDSHNSKQANSTSAAVAVLRSRPIPTLTKEMYNDANNKSYFQLHSYTQDSNTKREPLPSVTVYEPVNFSVMFRQLAVDEMMTQTIPVSLVEVWRTRWKDSTGFRYDNNQL